MSENNVLYRGVTDRYVADRELEQLGQEREGITVCRSFSTTTSGYLLYLSSDTTEQPPTIDRITWEQLNDEPNTLGQQGVAS
jgi:hypothetical protein